MTSPFSVKTMYDAAAIPPFLADNYPLLAHNSRINLQQLPRDVLERIWNFFDKELFGMLNISKGLHRSILGYGVTALHDKMKATLSDPSNRMSLYQFSAINNISLKILFESNALIVLGESIESEDVIERFVKTAFSMATMRYPINCSQELMEKVHVIADTPDNPDAIWAKMQLVIQDFFVLSSNNNWEVIKASVDKIADIVSRESEYFHQAKLISSFLNYYIYENCGDTMNASEAFYKYVEIFDAQGPLEHDQIYENLKGFCELRCMEFYDYSNDDVRLIVLKGLHEIALNNTFHPFLRIEATLHLAKIIFECPPDSQDDREIARFLKMHCETAWPSYLQEMQFYLCNFRLVNRISEEEFLLSEVAKYAINCLDESSGKVIWAKKVHMFLCLEEGIILDSSEQILGFAQEVLLFELEKRSIKEALVCLCRLCQLIDVLDSDDDSYIAKVVNILAEFDGELGIDNSYFKSISFLIGKIIDLQVMEKHISLIRILDFLNKVITYSSSRAEWLDSVLGSKEIVENMLGSDIVEVVDCINHMVRLYSHDYADPSCKRLLESALEGFDFEPVKFLESVEYVIYYNGFLTREKHDCAVVLRSIVQEKLGLEYVEDVRARL